MSATATGVAVAARDNRRPLIAAGIALQLLCIAALAFQPWTAHGKIHVLTAALAFAAYFAATAFVFGRGTPPPAAWIILLFAAAFRATLFFAPPTLSDDVYRYVWDGRVQNAGHHPYQWPPDNDRLSHLRNADYAGINHKHVPTIYPPFAQWSFRAVTAVSPTIGAMRLFFMLCDLAASAAVMLWLRALGRPAAHGIVYAWNPLVLVEFASSGHMDAVGILLMALGLWAAARRRWTEAGALWGFSFLTKFVPALLIPRLIFARGERKTLIPFALVVAAGYATFLSWPLLEVGRSLFSGAAAYAGHWHFNAGVYAVLARSGIFSPASAKIAIALGLAGLAFALAAKKRPVSLPAYAAIMVAAALAASPVVYPWYVSWMIPFLCVFPFWSGLGFTALVMLSYAVIGRYAAGLGWTLPPWIPVVEYGGVAALLAFDLLKRRRGA